MNIIMSITLYLNYLLMILISVLHRFILVLLLLLINYKGPNIEEWTAKNII